MSNEEKILQMLTEIQSDIKTLKEKHAENELEKLSPEERKKRQIAALDAFQKACAENRDDLEEFFALMDEHEAGKAAAAC